MHGKHANVLVWSALLGFLFAKPQQSKTSFLTVYDGCFGRQHSTTPHMSRLSFGSVVQVGGTRGLQSSNAILPKGMPRTQLQALSDSESGMLAGIAGFTIALSLLISSVYVVVPGTVGIVTTLGSVERPQLPGLHFKAPWISDLNTIDTKTLLCASENTVPTAEGLNVQLDVSLLYHVSPEEAANLYKNVGVGFEGTVVAPTLRSAVRNLTAETSVKTLYSAGRKELRDTLQKELEAKLTPRGIVLEDVLIKSLTLPKQLSDAIEVKLQKEQEAAQMQFVIQREQQEAERKVVEAKGQAEFNRIIQQSLSPEYLKFRGIEATEKLAGSQNSKIVVIGSGKDGLPLILGGNN